MLIGIQKRQWLLIFLTLSIPILLNIVALWRALGTDLILQIMQGTYVYTPYYVDALDFDRNPFPKILLNLLPYTVFLGVLAWFMIFISNRILFQRQPLATKIIEFLLMSSITAIVFNIVSSFFMPLAWLPVIYNTLGFPGSSFVFQWSRWVVLPTTAIILFVAMLLSGIKKKDTSSEPS